MRDLMEECIKDFNHEVSGMVEDFDIKMRYREGIKKVKCEGEYNGNGFIFKTTLFSDCPDLGNKKFEKSEVYDTYKEMQEAAEKVKKYAIEK